VILGVPAYGTLYAAAGGAVSALTRPAARDAVVPEGVTREFSPESISESSAWEGEGSSFQAFLESNRSLQARVSLAKRHGLRGVAVSRLGLLRQGWWDSVLEAAGRTR
jgi:spore germination protein YaaH